MNYVFFEGGVVAIQATPQAFNAVQNVAKQISDDIAIQWNNTQDAQALLDVFQNSLSGNGVETVKVLGAAAFGGLALAPLTTAFGAAAGATVLVVAGGWLAGKLYEAAFDAGVGIGERAGQAAYEMLNPVISPTLGTTPNPLPESLITAMQTEFGIAQTTQSPLILDLDGDGVETIGTGAGVHFDHDGNRFGELSGWVGKDDGLLVWDRNGNGQIDSGTELFGNNTVLANGQKAANGFAALGDLDANRDGKMDTTDAAFANLRVWKDANSNAVVDAGEFQTLTQVGVRSITTAFVSQAVTDANGNQHLQTGTFTTTAGMVRVMNDVWFSADTARLTVCDAAKTRTRKVATKSIAWNAYGSSAKGRFYAKKRVCGLRNLIRVTFDARAA